MWKAIGTILSYIIPAFLKTMFTKKQPDVMEYGHSNGATEKRLHEKIRSTWDKPNDSK